MIYTKKGDRGTTSVFEPDPKKRGKVSKSSLRIAAIGSIDELNSYLGISLCYIKAVKNKKLVSKIQNDLFEIGAILSKAPLLFNEEKTTSLEREIDFLSEKLPALRNFLIPSGAKSAVHIMYARSVCRKAERDIVSLSRKEQVPSEILKYVNRLSDLLFMLFRDENKRQHKKEDIWVGDKS